MDLKESDTTEQHAHVHAAYTTEQHACVRAAYTTEQHARVRAAYTTEQRARVRAAYTTEQRAYVHAVAVGCMDHIFFIRALVNGHLFSCLDSPSIMMLQESADNLIFHVEEIIHISDKGLVSRIHQEHLQISMEKINHRPCMVEPSSEPTSHRCQGGNFQKLLRSQLASPPLPQSPPPPPPGQGTHGRSSG